MSVAENTMRVMELVMEQEQVITGVKESARLNGGTLDAEARRQLEAAAARIAELTRMLEPFTASPPPAAGDPR